MYVCIYLRDIAVIILFELHVANGSAVVTIRREVIRNKMFGGMDNENVLAILIPMILP